MNTATNSRKYIIALCSLVISFTVTVTGATSRVCTISITNIENKQVSLIAEIADNDALRSTGLMNRKALEKNSGMIFMYGSEGYLTFWMKNTYIPLSIAYIGEDGVIHEIYDMKPLDTSVVYPSRMPARYALEMNLHWFRDNRITRGCRLNLHGCLCK